MSAVGSAKVDVSELCALCGYIGIQANLTDTESRAPFESRLCVLCASVVQMDRRPGHQVARVHSPWK